MRKAAVAMIVVGAAAVAAAAGADRAGGRVSVPGRISVVVPTGWHVTHGWLSDVTDPAPRLAVATFPVVLSRHTCACGLPNVVDFPRSGGFVFVWEYLHASRAGLARTPGRPARFEVAPGSGVRRTCDDGPSDTFAFKTGGRIFQVEVYLGPAAPAVLRAQVSEMLGSLRAGPAAT